MEDISILVLHKNDATYYDKMGKKIEKNFKIIDTIPYVQNVVYCDIKSVDSSIDYKNKLYDLFNEYFLKKGDKIMNIGEMYNAINPENINDADVSDQDKIYECYYYLTQELEGIIPVTELLRFLPEKVLIFASKYFKYEKIEEKKEFLNLKMESQQNKYLEQVSDINGIVIPMYHKYMLQGKIEEISTLLNYYDKNDEFSTEIYNGLLKLKKRKLNINDILYISNLWSSFVSGYIFKILQITKYDWISEEEIKILNQRMEELKLSKTSIFEKSYIVKRDWETFGKELSGYIDCIDGKNVWEFKYVKSISSEHFLQLAIYKYMICESEKNQDFEFFLYNIYTGEKYKITGSQKSLKEMVRYLFYSKYKKKKSLSDIEFITNMRAIRNEYI
jgi:hypothetical protein